MAKPDLEQTKRRFDNKEMSVVRTMDAMRIYIDYQSNATKWVCHEYENDFIFCEPPGMQTQLKSRDPIALDPYLVRAEFLSLKTPMEALAFLNKIGDFWRLPAITWKEIERWKDFLKIVAEEDFPSRKDASTEAAAYATLGIPYGFFTFDEKIDAIALEHMIAARPQESRKDLIDRRAELSLRLPTWFATPPEDAISLLWYPVKDSEQERGTSGPLHRRPYLHIEATCMLEALGATVWVDSVHGARYGRCKHCGKLFLRESEHGQQFCPPTGQNVSSSCKNAYMQKQLRERRKKEKRANSQKSRRTGKRKRSD